MRWPGSGSAPRRLLLLLSLAVSASLALPALAWAEPTLVDLGAGAEPIAVSSGDVVVLAVSGTYPNGAVWRRGAVEQPSPPATDPTAGFTPEWVNSSGVVAGNVAGAKVGYWPTATSSSFDEIDLSGLTLPGGESVSGAYAIGIDAQGDIAGYVSGGSGAGYERAGLLVRGSGGVPTGPAEVIGSVGGHAVESIESLNSGYAVALGSDAHWWLIAEPLGSTPVATSTDLLPVGIQTSFGMLNGAGTVVGTRESSFDVVARTATGDETQIVANGSAAYRGYTVNGSGTVAGAYVESAVEPPLHQFASTWSPAGARTELDVVLPGADAGWHLWDARAINDAGDVVGQGTAGGATHGYLFEPNGHPPVPPVVNSTGDAPAAEASSGSCDTGATVADANGSQVPECTLRAAIEAVNALADGERISFDIPGAALTPIRPQSPLPGIAAAGTVVDAGSEPGGTIQVDGSALGGSDACLEAKASAVTIEGFDLGHCPWGIGLRAPGHDTVKGNLIGVAPDGTTATPTSCGICITPGADGNTIGGTVAADRNVVSDSEFGLDIASSGNVIEGNLIGTDATGEGFLPDVHAVAVVDGSGNTIGGTPGASGQPPGNVIVAGPAAAGATGVRIAGSGAPASSNLIEGNLIGTDAGGARLAPEGAAYGVAIIGAAGGNTVGGAGGAGNVIAGARTAQVVVSSPDASGNRLLGNRIGASLAGESLPTSSTSIGVWLAGARQAVVGVPGSGNTISGQRWGIVIAKNAQEFRGSGGAALPGTTAQGVITEARVQGNVVGPLPGGGAGPADTEEKGIWDQGGNGDLIGPGNQLAWNGIGVELDSTVKATLKGNLIGTAANGIRALPNGVGVVLGEIEDGPSRKTTLGVPGSPDTISGNRLGVYDSDAVRTLVRGELIGTTDLGNAALRPYKGRLPTTISDAGSSYPAAGIAVEDGAQRTVIGGTKPGWGVTIASIRGSGAVIKGETKLIGDRIGVGRNGKSALPNTGSGVEVSGRRAKGSAIGLGVVAHNRKAGVRIHAVRDVSVLRSSIFANRKGGIVHSGKTKDPKPPRLMRAVNRGKGTTVTFEADVPGRKGGTVELFATPSCQKRGAGKRYLRAAHLGGGHREVSVDLRPTQAVGTAITATLSTGARGTSGFSACVQAEARGRTAKR